MITQQSLEDLCNAALLAGFNVNPNDLALLQWDAGNQTHIPCALPVNTAAVYIFKWNNIYLKVGKAGPNSNARYQSQHYSVNANGSTLAKSLQNEPEFHAMVGAINDTIWGEWIKENTIRFNVLIPRDLGEKFVHFAEAFFILKCNPMFENTRV